ncbi:MAG: LytTR family DNA-binding domain-containing protein [Flavobacteriaceae bacterium]
MNNNITAILIDDEHKALFSLKYKIEKQCPNITIIAETQSPKEGIKLIEKLKPQLVFLDIAMPELSGFDVLEKINQPNFEIIFVTAFDNYAIEAIQHCAIGYLVKPVNNKDLVTVVSKALENINNKTALDKNKTLIENFGVQSFSDKKIAVSSTMGIDFIKIETIIFCEGVDGYTKFHLQNKKTILSSRSLGFFKDILTSDDFYLVHKSYIINKNYIEKYLYEGYVVMPNQVNIPVARSRRTGFLDSLKNN